MSIKITGLQELLKDLDKKPAEYQRKVDEELTDGANAIEERAKLLAPVNNNRLRGSIIAETDVAFHKQVSVEAHYAPYMEFGTKGKFNDQGVPDVAAQFKGSGKDGDFVKSIFNWLKDKSYFPPEAKTQAQKLSYARFIAIRIAKNGVEAANDGTGYFFRAFREVLPTIISNIEKIKL